MKLLIGDKLMALASGELKKSALAVLLFCLVAMGSGAVAGHLPADLVSAARAQIGLTVRYDPSYRALRYPNGDVAMDRGVCSDVVIRALRSAYGIDLQQLVHEDMRSHFSSYPRRWGLSRPDRNIDHRRVPNLQIFFQRQRWALKVSRRTDDYLPGDIVTCTVPPHLPHIMVVSDRKSRQDRPLVIHNIGAGVREEDLLFKYPLTGHYRIGNLDPAGP